MFGGFAGSFFATRQAFISPESFTFIESAIIVAIVVLGLEVPHAHIHLIPIESEKDLDACNAKVMACFESVDYIEGRRAFMEKRTPIFEGK